MLTSHFGHGTHRQEICPAREGVWSRRGCMLLGKEVFLLQLEVSQERFSLVLVSCLLYVVHQLPRPRQWNCARTASRGMWLCRQCEKHIIRKGHFSKGKERSWIDNKTDLQEKQISVHSRMYEHTHTRAPSLILLLDSESQCSHLASPLE